MAAGARCTPSAPQFMVTLNWLEEIGAQSQIGGPTSLLAVEGVRRSSTLNACRPSRGSDSGCPNRSLAPRPAASSALTPTCRGFREHFAYVYGQVSESIFTDVTRNVGSAADDDCVELVVVEGGLAVDGFDVEDVVLVVVLLESIVPVISTLWLSCELRFTSVPGASM